MSKECMDNCPRIISAVENLNPDASPEIAAAGLLRLCQESYDCPGPIPTEIEVTRGFFRKRTTLVPWNDCGLEQ